MQVRDNSLNDRVHPAPLHILVHGYLTSNRHTPKAHANPSDPMDSTLIFCFKKAISAIALLECHQQTPFVVIVH